jgi:hypothetical protein
MCCESEIMLKVSKGNREQSLIHRHVGHGKAQAIVIHDAASGMSIKL